MSSPDKRIAIIADSDSFWFFGNPYVWLFLHDFLYDLAVVKLDYYDI